MGRSREGHPIAHPEEDWVGLRGTAIGKGRVTCQQEGCTAEAGLGRGQGKVLLLYVQALARAVNEHWKALVRLERWGSLPRCDGDGKGSWRGARCQRKGYSLVAAALENLGRSCLLLRRKAFPPELTLATVGTSRTCGVHSLRPL